MKKISMKSRKEIIEKKSREYKRARKKEKSKILDSIVQLIGYNRNYAARILRNYGKKVTMLRGSNRIVFIGSFCKDKRRKRNKIYDEEVLKVLKKIWAIMDFICGKRLKAMMESIINKLEEKNELIIENDIKEKLLKISSSTIDRLLKEERKKMQLKNRAHTKPGTLLIKEVPIKTFSELKEEKPGYIVIDLVAHDGGFSGGEFNYTLNCTDIATGWTECVAILNKAQIWTINAMQIVAKSLPFPILGIHSDNGSEFINAHFIKYCKENNILFTRSRPYKKNDTCYVEQKNWSIVRRIVGYYRYDSQQSLKILNQTYKYYRLYNNFFQPNMKLISKIRYGSKVRKYYDEPKTPFQRLLESPFICSETKEKLKEIYKNLKVLELIKIITDHKDLLLKVANRCYNNIIDTKSNNITKCLKD